MTLTLTIATPSELVLEETPVRVVRAEDHSGSFGIMEGHADLLTMMRQSIVRWRAADGLQHYCAVQGALLLVSGGTSVRISAREASRGDDLAALEEDIAQDRIRREDESKEERVVATRLHAQAVRALVAHLVGDTRQASFGG